jgi:hypothetical protein
MLQTQSALATFLIHVGDSPKFTVHDILPVGADHGADHGASSGEGGAAIASMCISGLGYT